MTSIIQLAINLAEAELRLRKVYQADMARPYLVEHHLCSQDYTRAFWDVCEAYWHWRRAMEEMEVAA